MRRSLPGAEDRFCAACREATGGNPLLVLELAADLARAGTDGADADAGRLGEFGVPGLEGAVAARLARLSDAARRLARTRAILGSGAAAVLAAELAGLTEDAALDAADELRHADLLAGDGFRHPLIEAAVLAGAGQRERHDVRRAAAARLAERGAPPDAVAVQLAGTEPRADPWVVEPLRHAAADAVARGAPEPAVAFLRRALAEPPPPESRRPVLLALGAAEAACGDPAATDHLAAVSDDRAAPLAQRVQAAAAAHRMLTWSGRIEEAVTRTLALIDELDTTSELAVQLEARALATARLGTTTQGLMTERLAGRAAPTAPGSLGDHLLLGALAVDGVRRGLPHEEVAALAEASLAGGVLLAGDVPESPALFSSVRVLGLCDHIRAGLWHGEAGMERARRSGSVLAFAVASMFRCDVLRRAGDLLGAEADARNALERGREHGLAVAIGGASAWLTEVLIERGALDQAEAVLAAAGAASGEVPQILTFNQMLHSRAVLHLERGDAEAALEDALICGERQEAWGEANPAMLAWREPAALARARLGDRDGAVALAAEQLERARAFGAPSTVARALALAGTLAEGREGMPALEEAVALLDRSPALLERTRTLVALGLAQVLAGERARARETLERAVELARRTGAGRLEERAREGLVAQRRPPAAARPAWPGRADRARARGRATGRRRPRQPRDRPGAVRLREDDRGPPHARVPQAGRAVAHPAARRARRLARRALLRPEAEQAVEAVRAGHDRQQLEPEDDRRGQQLGAERAELVRDPVLAQARRGERRGRDDRDGRDAGPAPGGGPAEQRGERPRRRLRQPRAQPRELLQRAEGGAVGRIERAQAADLRAGAGEPRERRQRGRAEHAHRDRRDDRRRAVAPRAREGDAAERERHRGGRHGEREGAQRERQRAGVGAHDGAQGERAQQSDRGGDHGELHGEEARDAGRAVVERARRATPGICVSTTTPSAKPATVSAAPQVPAPASVRRAAPSANDAATSRGAPKLASAPSTASRSGRPATTSASACACRWSSTSARMRSRRRRGPGRATASSRR